MCPIRLDRHKMSLFWEESLLKYFNIPEFKNNLIIKIFWSALGTDVVLIP